MHTRGEMFRRLEADEAKRAAIAAAIDIRGHLFELEDCPACDGAGEITVAPIGDDGVPAPGCEWYSCGVCDGTGQRDDEAATELVRRVLEVVVSTYGYVIERDASRDADEVEAAPFGQLLPAGAS